MNNNFGSLGDFFPETEIKCRIRGCNNVIHISGDRALHNVAGGKDARPNLMCPECLELYNSLEDKQVPCSKPGCDGTWTWNKMQQVEAHVQGKADKQPVGYCAKCRQVIKSTEDKQMPCRIHSCKNTWTWTSRMQMESKDGKAPHRLCDECFQLMNSLEDKELPCRVKGCEHKVLWTRNQQLEHIKSGKSLDKPPQWMCEDCMAIYKTLQPKEMKCKIRGCEGSWTYTQFEQLEAMKACKEGETPAVPNRMCKSCFDFYQTARDLIQPCRNNGCTNTWIWTRSMQLGAFVKSKGKDLHPVPGMCEDCRKLLQTLEDKQMPCQEKNCNGTWTYRPEEQLRDKLAKRGVPRRHCQACNEFLKENQAQTLTCVKCGKEFPWSSQEQLQHKLGNFDKPTMCAECTTAEIQEIQQPLPIIQAVRPNFEIKIPAGGKWAESSVIRDWPERMTREKIAEMENASKRIVCIGDDMTYSLDSEDKAWPALLETRLHARFSEMGEMAVLNAGVKGCTTKLGTVRFDRDVVPFAPNLLIFSFLYADTKVDYFSNFSDEQIPAELEKLEADWNDFLIKAQALENCNLLAWLPNPIFPQCDNRNGEDTRDKAKVDAAWTKLYSDASRRFKKICSQKGIEVCDAKSLFETCGQKIPHAWMGDCYLHNEVGANNIANWLESTIQTKNLLA